MFPLENPGRYLRPKLQGAIVVSRVMRDNLCYVIIIISESALRQIQSINLDVRLFVSPLGVPFFF